MKVVWRWLWVREAGDAYVYPMHFNERSIFLSIEAALELMISFALRLRRKRLAPRNKKEFPKIVLQFLETK